MALNLVPKTVMISSKHFRQISKNVCTKCGAGHMYKSGKCEPCGKGEVSEEGSGSCILCPPGTMIGI